jgi:hypothetical protein
MVARRRFAHPTDCEVICFAHKCNLGGQLRIAERLLGAAASELRSIALERSEAGAVSAGFLRLSV